MSDDNIIKQKNNLFSEGGIFNMESLEQFNKQVKSSWDQFSQILQVANKDAGGRSIVTNTEGEIKYKTDIKMDGDMLNDFPTNTPEANDLYWKRHNELVDKVMNERKDILLKVIEMAGTAMTKMVNPISFSTVDLVKMAEIFKKT